MNISKTLIAFENRYKDDFDSLEEKVHKLLLDEDWIVNNQKRIKKIVKKLMKENGECLLAAFVNKLAIRLPKLSVNRHEYDKEKAKKIAALLIVSMMMDSGDIEFEDRHESGTKDGKKVFYTRTYLLLTGSKKKDQYRGCNIEQGLVFQCFYRGIKHTADEKGFLSTLAMEPFKLNPLCIREILSLGYSLKKDWNKTKDKNGRKLKELPVVKRKRYYEMADKVVDTVKRLPAIYLSAKYCGRKRVYYDFARLDGIRPHGKEWEVSMWDGVPRILTDEDATVLRWIIYSSLHGKCSVEEANDKFEASYIALAMKPILESDSEDELGKRIRLHKACKALQDYYDGVENASLFGFDLTNSGLIMNAVSYHSGKMLEGANLSGLEHYVDSHMRFGEIFGIKLCRDDIKKIHMEVLHGGTPERLQEVLQG
ncbi:MAG: hypothetical protein DSY42_03550, partial [Aquifex sp.]